MNKELDITPHNEKGLPHGYTEGYWVNGNPWFKGNYVNNKRDGFWIWYNSDGSVSSKRNLINDESVGYIEWVRNGRKTFILR